MRDFKQTKQLLPLLLRIAGYILELCKSYTSYDAVSKWNLEFYWEAFIFAKFLYMVV